MTPLYQINKLLDDIKKEDNIDGEPSKILKTDPDKHSEKSIS